jgi:hypothetical protein
VNIPIFLTGFDDVSGFETYWFPTASMAQTLDTALGTSYWGRFLRGEHQHPYCFNPKFGFVVEELEATRWLGSLRGVDVFDQKGCSRDVPEEIFDDFCM